MTDRPTDWNKDSIVRLRETYYAASQRAFMPYRTPLSFRRGERQYLWDEQGKKYIDLLGMNVCISVGHAHPSMRPSRRRSTSCSTPRPCSITRCRRISRKS